MSDFRFLRRGLWTVALLVLAGTAVYATSYTVHSAELADWLGLLGGYVTFTAYMVMLMAALFAAERLMLPQHDFIEEIMGGNVALALLLGLLIVAFAIAGSARGQTPERDGEGVWTRTRCIQPGASMPIIAFAVPEQTRAVDTARTYVGVVERPQGSNTGPVIDRFFQNVAVGPGAPWCAAFVSYCYESAPGRGTITTDGDPLRSAAATGFRDAHRIIDVSTVLHGRVQVPAGSVVIWKRRGTWKGHAGLVAQTWTGRCGKTIEGNTRNG